MYNLRAVSQLKRTKVELTHEEKAEVINLAETLAKAELDAIDGYLADDEDTDREQDFLSK